MTQRRDKYQGFSLSSVCWGYRDIFSKTLESLFEKQWLGDHRPEVTETFFAFMRCAEQQHFDYVLKEFLAALNPQTAWLMDLPGVFAEVMDVGRQLAASKLHYGISYFRAFAEGDFGTSPQDVRYLMTALRRLRAVDDDLALAFLRGYPILSARLRPAERDVYVHQGLRAFHRNRKTGLRFMEGTLKSSEVIIQSLTRECRLSDIQPHLEKLLRALVGYEVEVGEVGRLDSDFLIERGTQFVCMARWVYVPARVRAFDQELQNRNWYRLLAVIAAGALSLSSFSRIHGHPAYPTCIEVSGLGNQLQYNLFQILEYARIVRGIRRMWPGARALLNFGIETEFRERPPQTPADLLAFALMRESSDLCPVDCALLNLADEAINFFDTAALLTPDLAAAALEAYPGLDAYPLRAFTFLPDFLYPAEIKHPPHDTLVADLKQRAKRRQQARDRRSDAELQSAPAENEAHGGAERQETSEGGGIPLCFLYDEWSQDEQDYCINYCHVYEKCPKITRQGGLPADVESLAAQTRRVFEMLRPQFSKEKYLDAGDRINVDLLTEYLIMRHKEPSPKVNFYEKPYKNQRDLATLILLDVSGSTGSNADREKTIEIEKRAALILGQGLATLGDRFSICGFSGSGREQCEFFIFKDFEQPWDRTSTARVLSAYPRSATRIGPALRHAGYRLSQIAAKQRLILLITDGKPMDTNYDPKTGYAQYDVRMACEENLHQGIHTFCLSTDDNSRVDMELMFPNRRFAILQDVRRLPHILPRLYITLTV